MIYLDNAASTEPAPEVLDALRADAAQLYANPSSAHAGGAAATRALEKARAEVAAALDVEPAELLFTSGGTEADALGVLGAARAARGRHIVVSALEHPAVMRCAEALAGEGWTLDVVAPAANGVVSAEAVAAAVRPDTAVVAVMLVNNELGTRQPVADIARLLGPAGDRKRPAAHICTSTPCRRSAWRACARARSAPTASPSPRTSCTARGAPARCGCARARGWRRCGSAAARSVACAAAARTCPPSSVSASPPRSRAPPCRMASRTRSPPSAIASSRRRWRRSPPSSPAFAPR